MKQNLLFNQASALGKRFAMVLTMLLTIGIGQAWGADYTLVTSNTNLNNGDKVIIATKNSSGKPNTGVTGQNGNNDATVSTTESNWVQYIVGSASANGWTLYDSGQGSYIATPTGNHFKYGTTAGTCFVNVNGVLGCNNRYLQANGTYYRMYSGINNSYTPFYVWKVSASYTITAQSNNTTYGTVSLSGTTITATPKTGYRVSTSSPFSISPAGSATVTQNGNTFAVTPTANCIITINFEAIPTHQIIFNTGGLNAIAPISVAEGSTYNITQEPTGLTNECEYNTFVGWTTENSISNPSTKPEIVTSVEMGNTDINLYAVYSKTEGGGGSGNYEKVTTALELEDGQYLIVCESGGVAFNGALTTLDAVGNTISVTITNNTIAPTSTIDAAVFTYNNTNNTLKSASGYYIGRTAYSNGLNVSTTEKYTNTITIEGSGNCVITASEGCHLRYNNASDQNRFRYYKSGQKAIQLYKKGNAGTTTYSLTPECSKETLLSVTSTLSHVTADGSNPTTITSEAEDLTLSYSAESGWNLPATISVTMGGTPLSSETDYYWDNGDLLIAPASGFTGNIVVTINGWQQLVAPTGLNVTNITSSGATLAWNAVTHATSYTVQVYGETDEIIAEYTDLTQTTKEVSGLESDTYYIWAVTAIGDGTTYTDSEESKTAEFTTLKACEKLGNATDLKVETNFVQDGQTYVKFSWIPADNTKNYAENQKLCFGKVDEAGTCVDNLAKNQTWTGDLASKLSAGEYWWSIQALGDETDYCDGDVVNGTNFYIYSITYNTNGGTTIPATSGTTLPDPLPTTTKTGYTFDGWYTDEGCTQAATAGAAITQNTTLYAKWTINQYTVTLNPNYPNGKTGTFKDKDGNTVSGNLVLTYDYGTASQTLTDLYQSIKLDGYRFDGWYNAKGTTDGTISGSKWSETKIITSDLNFYAKWTEVDCRWIETDIANIKLEDEVVITMLKDGHLYALDHSNGDTNYPPATEIFVSGNKIESVVGDAIQWNITGDATNGYTIYPNGTTDTWLFCSKSYVRVGDNPNKVFTIENGYLKRTNLEELWAKYIGVSISTSSWRHYDNTTGVIVNQTLKFYKRVCVDESNPWCIVTFDAGSGSCDTESLTGTKNEGITLPTATPSDACAIDGWIFAGWWTDEVGETTTSPGELLTAGSNYTPDKEGKILYAVYSKEETNEGGGATSTEATLSFASTAQRTSFSSTQQVWEQNGITLTNNQAASTSPVADYANPARFYANSEIIIEAPGNITQIVFECTENASELKNSVGAEATYNENIVTIIPTASSNTYTIAKLSKQVKMSSLTVTYLAESGPTITTTYNSNPSCEACENILTINKGVETNGNTFTLSQIDDIETCDGEVEVVVTPTPTEHYSVSEVTATTPTTGGTPTITNNGDGTWTVTYTQNSTGESTINVTFVQDAKASITLSELGEETTDNTTYYVGEQYTLPTTSSQSCDGKQLVGWSTVEVAETDTKPTENYYELGAEVTLAATQTFYAVFATAGEGGGGNGIVFKETFDTNEGTGGNDSQWGGTIASSDISSDHTWVFFNAKGAFKCAKFASNSSGGSATTPAIDCSGSANATLTFKAGSWKGDETTLNIESTNCTVDLTSVDLPDQTWGEYIVNITSITGEITITFSSNLKNRFFLDEVEITTSGGVSYTGYTTSCVPTYSITYDFAGGTGSHCSNTSVPQGESYTICEDEPTKTGYTFLHWSDSTTTYAAGATITPTSNITLTAVWQINTYTVIWSNNGATTEESYEHGQTLNVPAPEDIPSCDGVKEFVGWTEDNTFTYHATTPPSDLFTEKTATVTADATYYAVFATKGEGSANFVLGESGTFKIYANVNGTNYYAQGGVSSSKITSTTEAANASDYTLTHKGNNQYTIQLGNAYIGHSGYSSTDLNTTETTWTIKEGVNGSWRIVSPVNTSRALAYRASTYKIFKAYSMTSVEAGDTEYYDIEFGGTSSGYSDYTTTCQQIESIEVQNPQTEFYLTDDFTIGTGKVIATLSGGGTTDVTALATFSGYNMNVVGTYTVTVTYMGATATYDINVKPLDNAWVLTWNVSGKTNTGLGPRTVNKGFAIGTLPVPEVPAACEGKTFMGWTESNTVPSDGIGIVYITPETVPTDNTTYYAVFATVNNFSVQKPIEDITSGSKVVVVAVASLTADGGSGKAISSRTISITSQGVIGLSGDEVSISDETINTPHSTCIWTLTKEGGGIVLEQDGKYIRAVNDGYRKLLLETTKDYWTLTPVEGKYQTYYMQSGNTEHYVEWFDHTDDQYDEGEKYIGFVPYLQANDYGDFDMQFYVTANADGNADITDYTTGCEEYTITYYGFRGGYSTSTSSDGIIVLPVNSMHTVPNCGDVVKDHTNLGREFLDVWMTQPHGGHTFKPGDTFILTQDTTLYAQWELNTTTDVTLPTGVEDLAGTDVYVYGGNTLTMVPDIVTINSLTLKGGLQPDGSYQMPNVWIPDGATLVRNTNKIYLDLAINAKNWYPFAVPFATKNDQYLDYLDPVLRDASTYGKHFAIKTYDGARRAEVGEDKANNWTQLLRHTGGTTSYLEPGVGYIISAMTYPDKDTATIRIPMTVPNTWFENGEQTVVGSTSRNTIAVIAHTGAAATEHRRHAGWNFIASPYLSEFAGNKVDNDGKYINGWINIANQYNYEDTEIPYVTIPVYNFAYYEQKKVSEATLSPEWSFFVQIAVDGTINFVEEGRQTVPAGIAARTQEERSVKMDIDINLTDGRNTDQMGIIVCEKYSDAYEIGRDLEKMFGSAYNLVVYSLMNDNTPLAYQAVPLLNETHAIPIGYRAPEQGEYTFSLKQNTSSIDLLNEQYEQLVLVDYEKGALTNLLNSDYTFSSERTQSNSRFALYAVPRQDSSTELPNISDEEDAIRKIFYNGHLFIIRNGNVYNGNGQIVK